MLFNSFFYGLPVRENYREVHHSAVFLRGHPTTVRICFLIEISVCIAVFIYSFHESATTGTVETKVSYEPLANYECDVLSPLSTAVEYSTLSSEIAQFSKMRWTYNECLDNTGPNGFDLCHNNHRQDHLLSIYGITVNDTVCSEVYLHDGYRFCYSKNEEKKLNSILLKTSFPFLNEPEEEITLMKEQFFFMNPNHFYPMIDTPFQKKDLLTSYISDYEKTVYVMAKSSIDGKSGLYRFTIGEEHAVLLYECGQEFATSTFYGITYHSSSARVYVLAIAKNGEGRLLYYDTVTATSAAPSSLVWKCSNYSPDDSSTTSSATSSFLSSGSDGKLYAMCSGNTDPSKILNSGTNGPGMSSLSVALAPPTPPIAPPVTTAPTTAPTSTPSSTATATIIGDPSIVVDPPTAEPTTSPTAGPPPPTAGSPTTGSPPQTGGSQPTTAPTVDTPTGGSLTTSSPTTGPPPPHPTAGSPTAGPPSPTTGPPIGSSPSIEPTIAPTNGSPSVTSPTASSPTAGSQPPPPTAGPPTSGPPPPNADPSTVEPSTSPTVGPATASSPTTVPTVTTPTANPPISPPPPSSGPPPTVSSPTIALPPNSIPPLTAPTPTAAPTAPTPSLSKYYVFYEIDPSTHSQTPWYVDLFSQNITTMDNQSSQRSVSSITRVMQDGQYLYFTTDNEFANIFRADLMTAIVSTHTFIDVEYLGRYVGESVQEGTPKHRMYFTGGSHQYYDTLNNEFDIEIEKMNDYYYYATHIQVAYSYQICNGNFSKYSIDYSLATSFRKKCNNDNG
jgi:hypothetical protein